MLMIRDESNVQRFAIGNVNGGLLCETSPWGRAEHCMPVFAFKAAAAQTLQCATQARAAKGKDVERTSSLNQRRSLSLSLS